MMRKKHAATRAVHRKTEGSSRRRSEVLTSEL
jgi:hypothetical protein